MRHLAASLLLLALTTLQPGVHAEDATADKGAAAAPPTTDPEQARVAELKRLRLEGEMVTLSAGNKEVFALYLPSRSGKSLGGIVLLHDTNGHADSLGVVHSLRTRLPDAGWSTLSLQLPYAEAGIITSALLDDAQARIGAAIAKLQGRGSSTIALIGYGLGARAAVDYLAAGDNLTVQGLVLISMDGSLQDEPRLDGAEQLAALRPPILDIYGGRDQHAVIDSAIRRATAAQRRAAEGEAGALRYSDIARNYTEEKGSTLGYRQLRIAAADHNYTHQEAMLVRQVRGWLKRYVADTQTKP